jgi:hypothetical protein
MAVELEDLFDATLVRSGSTFGRAALTGDATASAGSNAVTIATDAVTTAKILDANVTLAKMANLAEATVIGRASGAGAGVPTALTATQLTVIPNAVVGDSGAGGTKGLVPAPAAGDAAAGKFLKADATWAVPAGAGDVVGPASSTDNAIARWDGAGGATLQDSAITIGDTGIIAFPDNIRQTFNPGADAAGLNVGSIAGDPGTPSNGDLWYDSTANELTARINGANVALGAGGGSGTAFELLFSTLGNEPPASNPATPDLRNSHPVLDFDGSTDEEAVFSGVLSNDYGGGGLTIDTFWAFTSATSGSLRVQTAIERIDASSLDIDADSFASFNSAGGTAPGTSGHVIKVTVTHASGAEMDSLAAGELFRLKIRRDADGTSGTDDIATDAELVYATVRET